MQTQTISPLQAAVDEVVNNSSILDDLIYLDQRWADEKEYEDWGDYEAQMKSNLKAYFPDYTFIKGLKRPIGFVAQILTHKIKITVKYRGNSACLRAESYKG